MKKCEKCGQIFKEEYTFCPECGDSLVELPEVIPTEKTKKCEVCECECDSGYEFCPKCGTSLVEADITQKPNLKKCRTCGKEYRSEYEFCPECGTKYTGIDAEKEPYSEDTNYSKESILEYQNNQTTKKKSKKKKIIIACCVIGVIAVGLIIAGITSPIEIYVNDGETITMSPGDSMDLGDLKLENEDLTSSDYKSLKWAPTSSENDVVWVKDNQIQTKYDADYFEETDNEGTMLYEYAYVEGSVKKGLRNYLATVWIDLKAEPKSFENGEIIKSPDKSRDSSINVTVPNNRVVLFYLKSKDDTVNDMAFLVKEGTEDYTEYVPTDEYDIYMELGKYWYGKEMKFLKSACYKFDEPTDFSSYTWELDISELVDSNYKDISRISKDDFPEL